MRPVFWRQAIVIGWLGAWAAAHAALSWQTAPPAGPRSFNSPDETANYFFARRIADHVPLAARAVADDDVGIIHPRSMLVHAGNLVPATFVGLPVWYGLAGRLAGPAVVAYVTPLLAALAGLAFYYLVREFFGGRVAWWSALALPLLPPWWYYSSRGLFHNVPFVALALLGGWGIIAARRHSRKIVAFIAGAAFGGAVAVRPVEAVWLLPVVALTLWLERRQLRRVWLVLGLGAVAALVPVLTQQALTYGQPLATGYRLPPVIGGPAVGVAAFSPFGFHPRRAMVNGFRFTFGLFPALVWPAVLGLALQLRQWRRLSVASRWALVATAGIAAWLVPYYGSAQLADNLDPRAVTLAAAYARYWLPLSVLLLPYAVVGASWIAGRLHGGWARRVAMVAALAGFAVWSVQLTVREPLDGLGAVARAVQSGYRKRVAVDRLVPLDAVVVAERSDKIFFPVLPVIATLRDAQVQQAIPALLGRRPVFWYTFMDDAAIASLQPRLAAVGLTLEDPVLIDSTAAPERLFRLQRRLP